MSETSLTVSARKWLKRLDPISPRYRSAQGSVIIIYARRRAIRDQGADNGWTSECARQTVQ